MFHGIGLVCLIHWPIYCYVFDANICRSLYSPDITTPLPEAQLTTVSSRSVGCVASADSFLGYAKAF